MINNKKIVAIIPVRGGSKGVSKKNLRKIQGQSLLALTIKKAKLSKYIDRVIVSSDDPELIDEAKAAGAEVPFIRPSALAQDETPGIEPILHAIEHINHHEYIVVLQVTSPLRTTKDIDDCIYHCHTSNAPACVTVTDSSEHPNWMFTIDNTQKLLPLFSENIITRRQDLPQVFSLNGAVYMAKTDWLKENKTFISRETIAYIMPKERSLDIDTEFDLILLESYMKVCEKA